jgi:hypothetical protein
LFELARANEGERFAGEQCGFLAHWRGRHGGVMPWCGWVLDRLRDCTLGSQSECVRDSGLVSGSLT